MKITSMTLTVFAAALTLAGTVHADAQDYNSGLKQELGQDGSVQAYPKRPKTETVEVQNVKVQTVQPAPAAPAQVQPVQGQVQPIYIVQQPPNAAAAQVEPTTTVEAQPVKESKIETLRRQREEVEHQTEDKLMQKLEDDRLVSEKDRSERIFAPVPAAAPAAPVAAPVAPAPLGYQQAPVAPVAVQVQNVQPVAPAAPPADESVSADVDNNPPPPADTKTKFTIGGLAGIGSYPTVSNVSGQYALGVMGNFNFDEGFGLELGALFSSYRITDANSGIAYPYGGGSFMTQMNQTNLTAGLTYRLLDGRISPIVGVLGGYTRRSYSNLLNYGFSNGSTSGSSAFDGGAMVGVDIGLTKKFSIGADVRYMMNISYRTDDPLAYYGNVFGTPLEGLSYYFASLNLKLAL